MAISKPAGFVVDMRNQREGAVLFIAKEVGLTSNRDVECRLVESAGTVDFDFYEVGSGSATPFAKIWFRSEKNWKRGEVVQFVNITDVKPLLRSTYTKYSPLQVPYFDGTLSRCMENTDRFAVLKQLMEGKLVELALLPIVRELQPNFLCVLQAVRQEAKMREEAVRAETEKMLRNMSGQTNQYEEGGCCSC